MDPLFRVRAGVKDELMRAGSTGGQGAPSGSLRARMSCFHAAGGFRACLRTLLARTSLGGKGDCSLSKLFVC